MNKIEVLLKNAYKFLNENTETIKSITKEFVNHKIDLIKDINNVSIVILPAFLIFINENLIKTKMFFWIGIVSLFLLIIINFLYRKNLLIKEEELLNNLNKYGQKLQNKLTDYEMENNIDKLHEIDNILQESFKPLLMEKNIILKFGDITIYTLFIIGIISLFLSLLKINLFN